VEWLVGQCNQDLENRWGHRPFGKQRLWHDTATISDGGYIRKSMLLGGRCGNAIQVARNETRGAYTVAAITE
jgi:hypothetical protein